MEMKQIALLLAAFGMAISFQACGTKTVYVPQECKAEMPKVPALKEYAVEDNNLSRAKKQAANIDTSAEYADISRALLKSCLPSK